MASRGDSEQDTIEHLDNAIQESNEELTADFRFHLGLLEDDDEGLSDAFKARIGLLGDEGIAGQREVEVEINSEREATLNTHQFKKFAKQNFISSSSSFTFSKEPITTPLLKKSHTIDKLASLAIWISIQRYMKDDRTPNNNNDNSHINKEDNVLEVPMMNRLFTALERQISSKDSMTRRNSSSQNSSSENYKLNKGWRKIFRSKSTMDKQRRPSVDTDRKDAKTPLYHEDFKYTQDVEELKRTLPSCDYDLIHFIVGHGILRRDLRDEIFCQICRQLILNPNKRSEILGWELMAFCTGCFKPSEQFRKYLMSFLYQTKLEFKKEAAYAHRLLRRTFTNGTRFHPPNNLEIEATRCKQFVLLPISFAGDNVENLEADSATTSTEMIDVISKKIGLKETFGFSIFIAIFHKVSSLGSGLDHVMDAISECEQVARAKNVSEKDARWRLFFRKELFTPWFILETSRDEVCAKLIYDQICKGVKSKEYDMPSNESMANFIAQRHLVDYDNTDLDDLIKTVQKFLPRKMLGNGGIATTTWADKVLAAYKEQGLDRESRPTRNEVIMRIANRSPQRWPVHFSALFVAFRLSGPRHAARNEVVIAISGEGVYVMDEPFRVIIHLAYYEIVDVSCSRASKVNGQSFSIITVKGEEFVFGSPNTDIIHKQLTEFLDGLRTRSVYAVSLENFIFSPKGNRFSFRKGDLIKIMENTKREQSSDLILDDKHQVKENWRYGRCERNQSMGYFPLDLVYILPTIRKPPEEFMECFKTISGPAVQTLSSVYLRQGTSSRSAHAEHSIA